VQIPFRVARFLYVLGIVLMLVGIVDAGLSYVAKIDLTGAQWSPMAFGLVGMALMWVSRLASAES
jgi:hypothetical protein